MLLTFYTLVDSEEVTFPKDLSDYGLTEELLSTTFKQVQSGRARSLSWYLKVTPTVGFYRHLHPYLKKWPLSRATTKVAIGKYYTAIDANLQTKGSHPYNTYRFIERVAMSDRPQCAKMSYGFEDMELKALQAEVKESSEQIQKLTTDVNAIRKELDIAKDELSCTRRALKDKTNEVCDMVKKRNAAQKESSDVQSDCKKLKEVAEKVRSKNLELAALIASVQSELTVLSDATMIILDENEEKFTIQTKSGGNTYSHAVRKLYYTLLADQIPPSKVASTIRAVLKCFFPNLDVERVQLPQERCAGYMRREELRTVSMAHKAAMISEHAHKGQLHMNTDGTTKNQKKLGSVALNGMVISVNELPDGTANSAIEDVSRELKRLRDTAKMLGMPHADSINWTLVASSTADSAATQKRFNKLIEQKREEDEEKFGPVRAEAIDLVTNFCSMHLGINLQKAFLSGVKDSNEESSDNAQREYYPTDTLVYEFCKLFGQHGTPEYGCGGQTFPDFLQLMSNDPDVSLEDSQYYQSCIKVKLERQVGNRYFVTAANALRVLYLSEAALSFLRYTGKDCGNKLESEVYKKLQDPEQLSHLKADGLMFYHVYADLVMLAKSNELRKSALDMNHHFLELQLFLQQLKHHPEEVMDAQCKVFPSENRLYADETLVNHRLHSQEVKKRLFTPDEWDTHLLYPSISTGVASMEDKLVSYAKDRLPGGVYWDPDPKTKAILSELSPSNDLCESILGLNDYLTTAMPNMHQMTRSNLIEVKKNKTIQWIDHLPENQFKTVVNYAVQKKEQVRLEYREEEAARSNQRREHMIQAKRRRDALQLRAEKERNELSQLHLITSPDELTQALADVDKSNISASKKKAKKLDILKTQVKIRKKVLKRYTSHLLGLGGSVHSRK